MWTTMRVKKNPEEASHIHSPPTRQQCCEIYLQEFNEGYQKKYIYPYASNMGRGKKG